MSIGEGPPGSLGFEGSGAARGASGVAGELRGHAGRRFRGGRRTDGHEVSARSPARHAQTGGAGVAFGAYLMSVGTPNPANRPDRAGSGRIGPDSAPRRRVSPHRGHLPPRPAGRLEHAPTYRVDSPAAFHLPSRLAGGSSTYRLDWPYSVDLPSRHAGFPRRNRRVETGSWIPPASRDGKWRSHRPVDPGSGKQPASRPGKWDCAGGSRR